MAPQFVKEWVLISPTSHMQHPHWNSHASMILLPWYVSYKYLCYNLSYIIVFLSFQSCSDIAQFCCVEAVLSAWYTFSLWWSTTFRCTPNSFRKYKCELTFSDLLLLFDNSILCVYDTGVNLGGKIIHHEFCSQAYFHCTHLTHLARVILSWTWKA